MFTHIKMGSESIRGGVGMLQAVQEIINLIDMRIKIHKEALNVPYLRNKRKRENKMEELEYLKETILLAYEVREIDE